MRTINGLLLALCAFSAGSAQAASEPCGRPVIDNVADSRSFLWQDCGTGRWHFRVAGYNGLHTRVDGVVVAGKSFDSVAPDSVEAPWDVVDFGSAGRISFSLAVRAWYDGFDFTVAPDASGFLSLNDGAPIYVGRDRARYPTPFQFQGPGTFTGEQFEEITAQTGIGYRGESWTTAWGDFNGDGLPDLWSSNHRGSRASLYLNLGTRRFVDLGDSVLASNPGVDPAADKHGAAWADVDNDGDQDLLVQVGGSDVDDPTVKGQFYRNDAGNLVEDAENVGLNVPQLRGRTPQWLDFDQDGLLDVMLSSVPTPGDDNESRLMRQGADGRFHDARSETGLDCPEQVQFSLLGDFSGDGQADLLCQNPTFPQRIYDIRVLPFSDITPLMPVVYHSFDAAVADFDGDLRPDIFITRTRVDESNALKTDPFTVDAVLRSGDSEVGINFSSSGILRVTSALIAINKEEIYVGAGGVSPNLSVNAARPIFKSFTLNSLDPKVHGLAPQRKGPGNGLYIGYDVVNQKWQVRLSGSANPPLLYARFQSINPVVGDVEHVGYDPANLPISPRLLVNNGFGFDDRTSQSGLSAPVICGSVAAADFDNDMDVDLYMVCDNVAGNAVNVYYENLGRGTFGRRENAAGAPGSLLGVGDGVSVADFDLDGFVDLYLTNGAGEEPIAAGPDQLYRNRGNGNHWAQFDLSGTRSNRDGIGARVLVTAGGVTQLREQNGGMHRASQNHQRLHVGLGPNAVMERVTIRWPSGQVQELVDLPADRVHTIVEPVTIPCGTPSIRPSSDAAALLWRDCATGAWNFRGTGAGGVLQSYVGSILSDAPISGIETVSIETGDDAVFADDPGRIDFQLFTNVWEDGFRFVAPSAAKLGIRLESGNLLLIGPDRTPVSMTRSRSVPFAAP